MLSANDYYLVEVQGLEWTYVLEELIIFPKKDSLDLGIDVILNLEQQNPIYYLNKAKFSAELLAAKFGVTVEQIKGSKVIRLTPYEESGDLPRATVPGFGRA